MPTSPQGVIAFYAANRLGALPAMIHPLSTAPEIAQYLDASGARIALTLDAFYGTLAAATPKRPLEKIVLARIPDYLSPLKQLGFWLAKGRKIPPVPPDPRVRWWRGLMADPASAARRSRGADTDDPAAILFSGGTTGSPKGIVLSNRNFIAEGMQAAAWGGLDERRLDPRHPADLPRLRPRRVRQRRVHGGRQVDPRAAVHAEIVPKLLRNEAARTCWWACPRSSTRSPRTRRSRGPTCPASRACFCGADTLPRPVKERFEALVARARRPREAARGLRAHRGGDRRSWRCR